MRLQHRIIIIGLIFTLSGCLKSKEQESSFSELSSTELDTIVFSSPVNFSKVLDNEKASGEVEIRSYKDILELFEKLKYTPESWQAGIREVPRVYLPIIGEKWRSGRSNEVTVEDKKRLFFRVLAPLVLRANEIIMMDRDRMNDIKSSFDQNSSLTEKEELWIKKLAKVYKVNLDDDQVTTSVLDQLSEKVDIVPVSLALAQAAEESGWGTSRFAALGNAVYGQWTWGENAIKPEEQRKELGNYGIASFETLQQSVSAYMLNLNTHNAYASLRDKRAELRKNSGNITGYILAGQLTKYSERGEEYVKGLRSLMEYNRLAPTDEAYLSNDPPIYLVPLAD
jgi:uncharacterized FlgJ-related protein